MSQRIFVQFFTAAFIWIGLSAIAAGMREWPYPQIKTTADLGFLAFASFYLHRKLTRALQRLEVAERTSREASVELVERLALVGEHRDDFTGGHARRIGRYAGILGEALGLDRETCQRLELASKLHDLGKVAIPDAILNKRDRLSPEERKEMERHAELGAAMLAGAAHPLLRTAYEIALTHHENWDGTGYPAGLAGEDIPLLGRIVAVCDVFDALTTRRPYKNAWTVEEATQEICKMAGTKFDPRIVQAFLICRDRMVEAKVVDLPLPELGLPEKAA